MTLHLTIAGEQVTLLAQRAAYWHRHQVLIVTDLHWGKSEALQRAGIPLPSQDLAADLRRLSDLVATTGAGRILILGDLVHAKTGMTADVIKTVHDWRMTVPELVIQIVRGNHDYRIDLPDTWRIEVVCDDYVEAPFTFAHGHAAPTNPLALTWSGHIHPSITLRAGADRLRLPCFVVSPNHVLMPAFGSLTGTMDIVPYPNARVFAIADQAVVEIAR